MDKLPLEIISQIFSYLPITDTWRLRRVSRFWQHNLSSTTAISNAIERYESHDPGDSAFPPATNVNEHLSTREQLLKSHYVASPLPYYSFTLNPLHRNSSIEEQVVLRAFKGRYFAMTIREGSYYRVVIKDLSNGQAFVIYADPYTHNNPIRTLCLTEDLVAYSSQQTLFTMRFDELGQVNYARRNRQDSRFSVYCMTGHKEKILVLWQPSEYDNIAITIYEHGLDQHQRFSFNKTELGIRPQEEHRGHYMLVDTQAQAYHLFSVSQSTFGKETINCSLNHVVMSFHGDVIHKRAHEYSIEQSPAQEVNEEQPLARIVSVGIPHVYHLCVASTVPRRWPFPTHHLLLDLERYTDLQISICARTKSKNLGLWKSMLFHSVTESKDVSLARDLSSHAAPEGNSHDSEESLTNLTIARVSPDLKHHGLDVASIWQFKSSKCCASILVNDSFLVWTTGTSLAKDQICHVFVFDERVTKKTARPLLRDVETSSQESPSTGTLLWKYRSVQA